MQISGIFLFSNLILLMKPSRNLGQFSMVMYVRPFPLGFFILFCLPIFPDICTIVNLVKLTRVSCHRSYDILARDISKFAVVYLSLYIAFSFAINYLNQAYVQYATAVDSSLMPSNYTSGCSNQIQTFSDVVYELFTMAFGDDLSGTLSLARGPPCGGLEVILNFFSCVAVCDQA